MMPCKLETSMASIWCVLLTSMLHLPRRLRVLRRHLCCQWHLPRPCLWTCLVLGKQVPCLFLCRLPQEPERWNSTSRKMSYRVPSRWSTTAIGHQHRHSAGFHWHAERKLIHAQCVPLSPRLGLCISLKDLAARYDRFGELRARRLSLLRAITQSLRGGRWPRSGSSLLLRNGDG